jgi:hypothetical protein
MNLNVRLAPLDAPVGAIKPTVLIADWLIRGAQHVGRHMFLYKITIMKMNGGNKNGFVQTRGLVLIAEQILKKIMVVITWPAVTASMSFVGNVLFVGEIAVTMNIQNLHWITQAILIAERLD